MNTLSLALCDDLEEERYQLARLLRTYGERRGIPLRLDAYADGAALLADYRPRRWQVIFLDIYMKPLSGVETARQILEQDRDSTLVFVTTSQEHGLTGYELGIADYLVKPCTQEDVDRSLDWILETRRDRDRSIVVHTDWREEEVLLRDIHYAEIRNHTAEIHLGNRVLSVNLSMKALEAAVRGSSFLRCHRSFLVNLSHVRGVQGHSFQLEDGTAVPIAPTRRRRARETFLHWMTGNGWREEDETGGAALIIP